jgi:glycosyltransferase involved in cell wall biosynthesis
MKILFVLENYLPTKNGGIENYSHWLASILVDGGHNVEVAFLSLGADEKYEYESVKVVKLKDRLVSLEQLLKIEQFDICHFHEYSGESGIGIEWFKTAAKYCKKVFFTFHLPYLTCYKGDFRYLGIDDCNDFSSVNRCVKCILSEKSGSRYLGLVASALGKGLASINISNPVLNLENRIIIKNETLDELVATCTNIFVYASWFKKILADNGYEQDSIKMIPYKTKNLQTPEVFTNNRTVTKNKILFVGRIEKQKGLHLLCNAMNKISSVIQLDVYGNIVEQDYYNDCAGIYSFNFKGTIKLADLLKILSDYDYLVLPSIFPEMYSMIVKDAFYEGLPVIVSASKGNRDAVEEGKNGFIFKYDDFNDLAKVIDKAYSLKKTGWEPVFAKSNPPEQDINEILSYYKI